MAPPSPSSAQVPMGGAPVPAHPHWVQSINYFLQQGFDYQQASLMAFQAQQQQQQQSMQQMARMGSAMPLSYPLGAPLPPPPPPPPSVAATAAVPFPPMVRTASGMSDSRKAQPAAAAATAAAAAAAAAALPLPLPLQQSHSQHHPQPHIRDHSSSSSARLSTATITPPQPAVSPMPAFVKPAKRSAAIKILDPNTHAEVALPQKPIPAAPAAADVPKAAPAHHHPVAALPNASEQKRAGSPASQAVTSAPSSTKPTPAEIRERQEALQAAVRKKIEEAKRLDDAAKTTDQDSSHADADTQFVDATPDGGLRQSANVLTSAEMPSKEIEQVPEAENNGDDQPELPSTVSMVVQPEPEIHRDTQPSTLQMEPKEEEPTITAAATSPGLQRSETNVPFDPVAVRDGTAASIVEKTPLRPTKELRSEKSTLASAGPGLVPEDALLAREIPSSTADEPTRVVEEPRIVFEDARLKTEHAADQKPIPVVVESNKLDLAPEDSTSSPIKEKPLAEFKIIQSDTISATVDNFKLVPNIEQSTTKETSSDQTQTEASYPKIVDSSSRPEFTQTYNDMIPVEVEPVTSPASKDTTSPLTHDQATTKLSDVTAIKSDKTITAVQDSAHAANQENTTIKETATTAVKTDKVAEEEASKKSESPKTSAALISLTSAIKSALSITEMIKLTYPNGVCSPAANLRQGVPEGTYRYDRDFLLQFQTIYIDKPSFDWDNRLAQSIGLAENRGNRNANAGNRSSSRNLPPLAFEGMGTFGTGKPPGVMTSADRFRHATRALQSGTNPAVSANPPFGVISGVRPGMGAGRSPSSPIIGSMPNSPSRRSGRAISNRRDNKSHGAFESHKISIAEPPVEPLTISENRWKLRAKADPVLGSSSDTCLPPDVVQRKVKALLNKLTLEKFDKITDQILEITAQSKYETDGQTLRQVIALTFDKATDEPTFSNMYARFCRKMMESIDPDIHDENVRNKEGIPLTGGQLFRKYLLNRCQEEFERGWKINIPPKPEGAEETELLSDEYYVAAAAKRRGLGLVQLIGELYKLDMLIERIMHECIKRLLRDVNDPEEEEIESLCKLLTTVGQDLDHGKGGASMGIYYQRLEEIYKGNKLNSRFRFMILDLLELRKNHWHNRSLQHDKGPKTIAEIHKDAAKAKLEAEQQRLAHQSRSRLDRMHHRTHESPRPNAGGIDGWNTVKIAGRAGDMSKIGQIRSSSSGPVQGGFNSLKSSSGRRSATGSGHALSREPSVSASSSAAPASPQPNSANASHTNMFDLLKASEHAPEASTLQTTE